MLYSLLLNRANCVHPFERRDASSDVFLYRSTPLASRLVSHQMLDDVSNGTSSLACVSMAPPGEAGTLPPG
jgi:hypothetical protein